VSRNGGGVGWADSYFVSFAEALDNTAMDNTLAALLGSHDKRNFHPSPHSILMTAPRPAGSSYERNSPSFNAISFVKVKMLVDSLSLT
jgi:hypothetical protein